MNLFRNPEALWLLLLLPLLAWRHWRALRGGGAALRHPAGFAVPGSGAWAHHLHFALKAAAFALLVVALARPQQTLAGEDVSTEGVDIMLALDTSGSMDARDFQPRNRLEVAKRVAMDFIKGRVSDRIGLVVFSARAITRCPLTVDYDVLLQLTDSTQLGMLPDGTAIGNALATAVNRLRESDARSKVVILITDGDNNRGQISPLEAARLARAMGVRIFPILVGTGGVVPYPDGTDLLGRPSSRPVQLDVNPGLLRDIAATTGGAFATATDRAGLEGGLQAVLDRMEKTRIIETTGGSQVTELFPRLLGPAFALVALGLLLGLTRWRSFP